MVTKRKPGRPRKTPEASVPLPRKRGRPPKNTNGPQVVKQILEMVEQPITGRVNYVYRPGRNGDHVIDAETIAVHSVTPIAKAASRHDAECLVRILNNPRP